MCGLYYILVEKWRMQIYSYICVYVHKEMVRILRKEGGAIVTGGGGAPNKWIEAISQSKNI